MIMTIKLQAETAPKQPGKPEPPATRLPDDQPPEQRPAPAERPRAAYPDGGVETLSLVGNVNRLIA